MCFIHAESGNKDFFMDIFSLSLISRAINAKHIDHNNNINSCNRMNLMYMHILILFYLFFLFGKEQRNGDITNTQTETLKNKHLCEFYLFKDTNFPSDFSDASIKIKSVVLNRV